MLMVTVVSPPMGRAQPVKRNQQKAPPKSLKVPQQKPKVLQAVPLILLQLPKVKQIVKQRPDEFTSVVHFIGFRLLRLLKSGND